MIYQMCEICEMICIGIGLIGKSNGDTDCQPAYT